jgi:serine/threonine protein kinase
MLMLELLGPSLQDLMNNCGERGFSLKTVFMLGYQLINTLEAIHNRNILHRDLKPANILMGLESYSDKVYIVDFGLAKVFRHPQTLEHLPTTRKRGVVGTASYVSINCHMGNQIGFVFI